GEQDFSDIQARDTERGRRMGARPLSTGVDPLNRRGGAGCATRGRRREARRAPVLRRSRVAKGGHRSVLGRARMGAALMVSRPSDDVQHSARVSLAVAPTALAELGEGIYQE